MPKSAILPPVRERMTFSGLMSRWRMPSLCANVQRAAEIAGEARGFAGGERAAFQAFFERWPFDVLEHEVEPELRVFAHVVQRDEVRVRDARGGAGLVAHAREQAFAHVARDEQIAAQELHGDVALRARDRARRARAPSRLRRRGAAPRSARWSWAARDRAG